MYTCLVCSHMRTLARSVDAPLGPCVLTSDSLWMWRIRQDYLLPLVRYFFSWKPSSSSFSVCLCRPLLLITVCKGQQCRRQRTVMDGNTDSNGWQLTAMDDNGWQWLATHGMEDNDMPWHECMPCRCNGVAWHAMTCDDMPRHAIACRARSWHAMPFDAVACHGQHG